MSSIIYEYGTVVSVYVFLLGLCFGSFLNVVILRSLSNEDIVFARSKCPKCNNQLKWYMNIPLLSYIFLKGRCAYCREKISIQYPIIELLCAILFLIAYINFGLTLKTLFICIFFFLFLDIAVTDLKEKVVIDTHCYILLAIGFLYSVLKLGDINWIQSIIGAVGGFLAISVISYLGKFIVKERLFGEGDSLIVLALGAIFGIKELAVIIPLAIVIQAIFVFPSSIIRLCKIANKKYIASFVALFFILICSILAQKFHFFETVSDFWLYSFVIVSVAVSIYSFINIVTYTKNNIIKSNDEKEYKTNDLYVPFGPALVISATLALFFLNQIKAFVINFLWN